MAHPAFHLNGGLKVAVNWLVILAAVAVMWWRMARVENAADTLTLEVHTLAHEVAYMHGILDRLQREH